MSGFQLFIARFGWLGIFRLLFYPITALVATPLQLLRSIWNCRVLLNGKWSHYPHFDLVQSLNTLFYWTRARNFHERGRAGYAPYLGLGEYPLSRGFHYSLTSLFAYWTAPVVVLLVGMCCWWASHLIWVPQAESMVFGITMMLAVTSTGFYAQLFSGQNYNVVGWAFFPLVLAGVYTGNPWLAATALILTSLGGITTFIIGVAFAGYQGVFMAEWLMLPAILPGAVKILTQFSPLFSASSEVRNKIMGNVLKAIGFTAQKAQYKRQLTKLRFDPYVVYNLF
ncbi:MAG: hypothetical protein AAGB22_03525, partial [Bacteroidota bacterium]